MQESLEGAMLLLWLVATYVFSLHYQFCRSLHLLDLIFSHKGLHLNSRGHQRSQ